TGFSIFHGFRKLVGRGKSPGYPTTSPTTVPKPCSDRTSSALLDSLLSHSAVMLLRSRALKDIPEVSCGFVALHIAVRNREDAAQTVYPTALAKQNAVSLVAVHCGLHQVQEATNDVDSTTQRHRAIRLVGVDRAICQ